MDLEKEEFVTFLKPNDTPIYVDAGSHHPRTVLDNIPKGINKRLSTISASKEIFDKAVPVYQAALEKSGHTFQLSFEECQPQNDEGKRLKTDRRRLFDSNHPIREQSKLMLGNNFFN